MAETRDAATFSRCGTYRYQLARDVSMVGAGWALFIMLNPSTADASCDDPTVRRCMGFAQSWGCRGVEVANLFALRATDPRALRHHSDPVGPENDQWIRRIVRRSDLVVCAWGAHGAYRDRWYHVNQLLTEEDASPLALGITAHGQPRHPLYLPRQVRPAPWGVL